MTLRADAATNTDHSTKLNVIVGEETAASTSVISDYITALSEQGMFISTSIPNPVGIHIPMTIFLGYERIKVEGLVLYSFSRQTGPMKTPRYSVSRLLIFSEEGNTTMGSCG